MRHPIVVCFLLLFVLSGCGGSDGGSSLSASPADAQTPTTVTLTNDPININLPNPVPIELSVTVDAPPVTVNASTGLDSSIITSYFINHILSNPMTLTTVPQDKTLVIKDIIMKGSPALQIFENDTLKASLPNAPSYHFNAGITFVPGSTVKLSRIPEIGQGGLEITIGTILQ